MTTTSERDTWLRLYYAPEYKRELARLRDWGVEPPEGSEDEDE